MTYVLAIHGGAGTIAPGSTPGEEAEYHNALQHALACGHTILEQGGSAVDAVLASVVALEDCPLFNAGRGSVYTGDAEQEMDAILMDGRSRAAGAVAGVRTVKNPVLLAQAVLQKTDCVLLVGEGAERFAIECGMHPMPPAYFACTKRLEQLHRAQAKGISLQLDHDGANQAKKLKKTNAEPLDPDTKFGTVGAVARDRHGNLASAVSTGGLTNKRPGRIGDTPIIGAGCYADNQSVAVAATGTGEYFMRAVLAYDIAARMQYAGLSLEQAAQQAMAERLTQPGGQGGIIAIDRDGNLTMPFNTSGMYRASVREGGTVQSAIFR
jgi:beta-aspartyl-peptidase (threonine type)